VFVSVSNKDDFLLNHSRNLLVTSCMTTNRHSSVRRNISIAMATTHALSHNKGDNMEL